MNPAAAMYPLHKGKMQRQNCLERNIFNRPEYIDMNQINLGDILV